MSDLQQLVRLLLSTNVIKEAAADPYEIPFDGKLPDHIRAFDDTKKTRSLVYNNALDAVKKSFPVEDDLHKIELVSARWSGPTEFTYAQQKQALMNSRSLRTPLTGKIRLIDKATGSVLDEKEEVLMTVPHYTDRGTFINGGNEYAVANQSRLRPGVYHRTKQSGEHEAQFNVEPGNGVGFKLWLEPQTGIFRFNLKQANIPAYPVLKAMGVDDKTLMNQWGAETLARNQAKRAPDAVDKFYTQLAGSKAVPTLSHEEKVVAMRQILENSKLDPEVTERTLGRPHVGITPEVLVRSSQKILNMNRGDEEGDDRDEVEFGRILGPEDYVHERIVKDAGGIRRNLLFQARRTKNLAHMRRGAFTPYMDSMILSAGYAQPIEETNPTQLIDQQHRIIKLGEGGISSPDVVTEEGRDVKPGQVGFIDVIAGPESEKIGIDVRAAYKTFKGNDGKLYAEFKNRSGASVLLTPEKLRGKVLAFPGQEGEAEVHALRDGKVVKVSPQEVDYHVPSQEHMYAQGVNMTPMPTSFQSARAFYASKYWGQFLPLVKGETPLVQTKLADADVTADEHYGRRAGTLSSHVEGVVTKITDGGITIRDKNDKAHFIETVKDMPFNRMTGLSFHASVKEGDVVKPGQMIAHSNFTDKDTGAFNMGVNLKTAVVPMKGWSFDDSYALSASAAKKLATERLYGFDHDSRDAEMGKSKYVGIFQDKFTNDQLANIGDNGVVKPGTLVKKGDPLILAVGQQSLSAKDAYLGKLHKTLRSAHKDAATVWESETPGVVTDVGYAFGQARVNVKASSPLQLSDKIVNSYSSKGVVGKIIPDEEMPIDPKTGEPYEVIFNPMAVTSRVAPNQLLDMQLAKVAKKTGQAYRLPSIPPKEGWHGFVKNELAKNGLSDVNDIYDPVTKRHIKGVADGFMYIHPFHHLAEKKISARSTAGYSSDEQPGRSGGYDSAKRMSGFDVRALLSHGALEVLRDSHLVRGQQNEKIWNALRTGAPLPEPEVPFVYEKFANTLRAGGINYHRKGDRLHITPMTDKDIDALNPGEILNSSTVDSKDLTPAKGGLFDEVVTGGTVGNRWGKITLHEPMPNPVMEEPIRRVLGLTKSKFEAVLSGAESLPGGGTGGAGIKKALESIDIDSKISDLRNRVSTTRGADRDSAIKQLRYLDAARKMGQHPGDWVLTKVPVLPPKFRPISRTGDMLRAADLNGLYRDVIEHNQSIKELREEGVTDDAMVDDKMNLYRAVSAAMGTEDAVTDDGKAKNWKGAIRGLIGDNPKFGFIQSKMLSKPVDLVGRSVVTPDPNLDMDSVGLPEDMCWDLFKPFVTRHLAQRGYPPAKAAEMVVNRSKEAEDALHHVMSKRPVIMNRAPSWHKFNVLGFHAHMNKGEHNIRTSPLIVGGFNMDYDGDAVQVHVPLTDKAVAQTYEKLLPSKNLTSITDLKSVRHGLGKEMSMGLWKLTKDKVDETKPPQEFATVKEVEVALRTGKLSPTDPVIIKELAQ